MLFPSQGGKILAFSLLLAGVVCVGGRAANAQTGLSEDVLGHYVLHNVSFSDGTSATGTFTYDFTAGAATNVNVIAEGGYFTNSVSYPTHITTTSFDGNYDKQQISYNLAFLFNTPLTPTQGSAITLDSTQSYVIVDSTGSGGVIQTYSITSGRVDLVPAVVPEITSPLTTGLGLVILGVLMRRRIERTAI